MLYTGTFIALDFWCTLSWWYTQSLWRYMDEPDIFNQRFGNWGAYLREIGDGWLVHGVQFKKEVIVFNGSLILAVFISGLRIDLDQLKDKAHYNSCWWQHRSCVSSSFYMYNENMCYDELTKGSWWVLMYNITNMKPLESWCLNFTSSSVRYDLKLLDDNGEVPRTKWSGWGFGSRLWNILSAWHKN